MTCKACFLQMCDLHRIFIYLGFYVAFNIVQVISRWVVGREEETSTYSLLGFCTVNCRPTASNYQLSHLRCAGDQTPASEVGGELRRIRQYLTPEVDLVSSRMDYCNSLFRVCHVSICTNCKVFRIPLLIFLLIIESMLMLHPF